MKYCYRLGAALVVALLTPCAVFAVPHTKQEIETIVHEYILKHPELLLESIEGGQKREMETLQENAKEIVKTHRGEIYGDPATPALGPKRAKLTIVEFFDYNCGACKAMFPHLMEFIQAHTDVRVIFKELPIFGEASEAPAKVALAVHRLYPKKYLDFHIQMMGQRGHVTTEAIRGALDAIGVDKDKVLKEAELPEVRAALDANAALAAKLQAPKGPFTPLVIIGDTVIPGAVDKARFERFWEKDGKE